MPRWNHVKCGRESFIGVVVALYQHAFWWKPSKLAAVKGGLCFELSKRDDSETDVTEKSFPGRLAEKFVPGTTVHRIVFVTTGANVLFGWAWKAGPSITSKLSKARQRQPPSGGGLSVDNVPGARPTARLILKSSWIRPVRATRGVPCRCDGPN
jgi:hypothetical protein